MATKKKPQKKDHVVVTETWKCIHHHLENTAPDWILIMGVSRSQALVEVEGVTADETSAMVAHLIEGGTIINKDLNATYMTNNNWNIDIDCDMHIIVVRHNLKQLGEVMLQKIKARDPNVIFICGTEPQIWLDF